LTRYTFVLTSVIWSAENDALRKASTSQPTGLASIPRPEKGVAGKGFNLRAAMGLGEDPMLYCTVRVSLIVYYFDPSLCLIIHSVASGTWQTEPD
jgi:hypothetical protein